jgi:hypothetical protein
MTRLRLSTAMIAAALIATPAMARESQVTSRHLTEEAKTCTTPGAYIGGHPCHGNRPGGFGGYGDRDVWGHWGDYYGPMIHVP